MCLLRDKWIFIRAGEDSVAVLHRELLGLFCTGLPNALQSAPRSTAGEPIALHKNTSTVYDFRVRRTAEEVSYLPLSIPAHPGNTPYPNKNHRSSEGLWVLSSLLLAQTQH